MAKISAPIKSGAVVTSHFAPARKLFGQVNPHSGLDVATPSGKPAATIHACAHGTVAAAGTGVLFGHSGNIVIIDHGGYHSVSGHLQRIDVVAGQRVQAGQVIGIEGATGRVTGRHLHDGKYVGGRYDKVKKNFTGGSYVDPLPWYRKRGVEPGRTAPLKAAETKPAASDAPRPKAVKGGLPDNKTIQIRLSKMGLYSGSFDQVNGPLQKKAVARYQKLNGLVSDQVWGSKTDGHYHHVCCIQRSLNRCKGQKLAVDGHMPSRGLTRKRIADVKQRNGLRPVNQQFTPGLKHFLVKIGAWG